MAFDKDAIIASLKEASISDLNDLVKAIEEEFAGSVGEELGRRREGRGCGC